MEQITNNMKPVDQKDDNKPELTPGQIRKRKMLIAIPLMLIPFFAFMYWIFMGGNVHEKTKDNVSGYNVEIPSPSTDGIVDDKRKAYEKEQTISLKDEKMRTLQDYFSNMNDSVYASNDTTIVDEVNTHQTERKSQNAINRSAETYREATRQINSFYQDDEADSTRKLEEEVLLLKQQLASVDSLKNTEPNQLDLMEKSYQMAAKYLHADSAKKESTSKFENIKAVPVGKTRERIVSGLEQPISDSAFIARHSKPRNYGFISAVADKEGESIPNTIQACIHDNQTVTDGSRVKLRLLDDMEAGNTRIPRNSIIFGTVRIQEERMDIFIPGIEYEGNIIPVGLSVYDLDGQLGIYVPGSKELKAGKEALANMGQGIGTSISFAQSAGQQLIMDLTRGAMQSGSGYLSQKFRTVKVSLKSGYRVLLMGKDN